MQNIPDMWGGKKKKASYPTPVGKGLSQFHYSKNAGPYPESPFIFQSLKENLKDALSHSLNTTAEGSTGWCSAVLKLSFALGKKKREEVKHLLLKDFT